MMNLSVILILLGKFLIVQLDSNLKSFEYEPFHQSEGLFGMKNVLDELECKLDSFDYAERRQALDALCEMRTDGDLALPEAGADINLHCHTFFSYNSYGYSPSKFAYLSRKRGLAVAGVVDFDVLDGLEEFLEAAKKLGLKGCVGIESRVFVPEFSDKVINSPGEPGISYHMGVGFPKSRFVGKHQEFLESLRDIAQQRNHSLMERVNAYLRPAELDYEKDVVTLTPSGNPTERHICLAYARKASKIFGQGGELAKFWSEKLGVEINNACLPEGVELLNTIRSKTMKRGGVGYVQPDAGAFPKMAQMNEFVLAAGGIPTMTWLDGTSDGEKEIERLVEVAMKSGTAAVNLIPDRNITGSNKAEKTKNLYEVVELAERLNLPIVVGTEMNSPGQKFVDSFDTEALKPLVPIFLKGAHIVYAHSVLQQKCGLGYTSGWAGKNFAGAAEKNKFFEKVGRNLRPKQEDVLAGLGEDVTSKEILERVGN